MPKNDLHDAVRGYKLEDATRLLREHPEMATQKDDFGRTPLHYAANGQAQITELLLSTSQGRQSARMQDPGGATPLHIAARTRNNRGHGLRALIVAVAFQQSRRRSCLTSVIRMYEYAVAGSTWKSVDLGTRTDC